MPPTVRLLPAERLRQLVAAHLRPTRDVPALRLLVQLGARLRRRAAGALALRDRSALLAQRGPLRLRHVRERTALLRAGLRLLDVPLRGFHLLRRRHRHYLPTARSSSALFIFERPSMPLLFASL